MTEGTYQVAHNNLALANEAGNFGGRGLAGVASGGLGVLVDATDRSRLDGVARSRAARYASAACVAALGRENLIERLVELARHDGYGDRS